jgi:PKD repeat protein
MKKIIPVILCLLMLATVPVFAVSCGLPQAAFTVSVSSGAAPLNVTFTNTTEGVDKESKVVFDWDFGDGEKMTATKISDTISHKYTKAGTYTVKITAYNPEDPKTNTFITATVTVTHGALTILDITPETVELKIGETKKFSSAAFDDFTNPITEASLTWKDGDAGTVATDGSFTAGKKAGTFDAGVILTGELGGAKIENSPKITILPDPLDKATIETLEIAAGEAKTLVITSTDQYGNKLTGLETTWSIIDGRAGTVTASGIFTASRKAATYDTAVKAIVKQGDKITEATGIVKIIAGPLAKAALAPDNIAIGKAMTQQYVTAAADKYGNRLTGVKFTWSSVRTAGSISADGLFTAGSTPGKYTEGVTVTATLGGKSITAQTTVTVNDDRIMFFSDRADENSGAYSAYVMNTDGTDVKKSFSNGGLSIGNVSCFPDGRSVVYGELYTDSGAFYITNIDGTWTSSAASGKYLYPSVSPDGTKIAFVNAEGTSDIYFMDLDGGNMVQVTNDNSLEFYPTWSPDGQKIVYCAAPNTNSNIKVWGVNTDGTGKRAITSGLGNDFIPQYSPDGSKILFQSSRNGQGFWGIYTMNADGSGIKLVFGSAAKGGGNCPTWSPDGTKVVFHSFIDDENGDIYIMNADGSNVKRITNTTATDWIPFWLPPAQGVKVSEESVTIPASFEETELTAKEISAIASPSVVRIKTNLGSGTGFIISKDGLIMTNNHVISEATEITVYTTDGKEYKGTVLARDQVRDLALVDIDGKDMPFLEISNLDNVTSGQKVVVMGYPLGQETVSITSGLISSIRYDDGRNVTWLQTDSAVNPGNSGGPLLDMNGRVIGVISSKMFGIGIEGIGFAISANTVNVYLADMR